jgi:putative transposase
MESDFCPPEKEVTAEKLECTVAEEGETGGQEIWNGTEFLPYEVKRRLEVLQQLKAYEGSDRYREVQEKAAQELNISLRSLYRLMDRYRKQGVEGLRRKKREDRERRKISEDWQKFIINAYRKGNKGTRETSPSEVQRLVEIEAKALGTKDYPSQRTIYRLLETEMKEKERKGKRRSIGWNKELLKITTREGIELDIDYSNQVWQCDHTPMPCG